MSRGRPLGSAHRGLASFLIQRLSSIYLGAFAIYFIVYLIVNPLGTFSAWNGYFGSGVVRLAWAIFIASLLAHIWVGVRSVYMDYLKPTWVRFTVSTVTALVLIALAFWATLILLRGVV